MTITIITHLTSASESTPVKKGIVTEDFTFGIGEFHTSESTPVKKGIVTLSLKPLIYDYFAVGKHPG